MVIVALPVGEGGRPRLDTGFSCARQQIKIGQAVDCTVDFTGPAREIQAAYWDSAGLKAAARCGQAP